MKDMIKRCIPFMLFIWSLPFVNCAQALQLSESMGRSRQISLEVGTRVGVRFFDHTKKNRGVKCVSGPITQLNDSSITIKKSMTKQEVTINVHDIHKLQRQKAGKYVIAVALPVVLSVVSVTAYTIAPPLIALSIFPSVGLANVIFHKHAVKHPLEFKIIRP